jgi:hypothetical protein
MDDAEIEDCRVLVSNSPKPGVAPEFGKHKRLIPDFQAGLRIRASM